MEMVKTLAGQDHVDVLPSVCEASTGKNDALVGREIGEMRREILPGCTF